MLWIQFNKWFDSKEVERETIKFVQSLYNLEGKKLIGLEHGLI